MKLLEHEDPKLLHNHGVLIDPKTMKIIFSFNMAFADLHREGKRLVRFPLLDIFPIEIPDYYGHPCRDGDPCFGERAKERVARYGYFPRPKVTNCLDTFVESLSKHKVLNTLPGQIFMEEFSLIKIWAKTNFTEDCRIAYPNKTKRERMSLPGARGDNFREYGLLIDKEMRLVYAFNTAFARYDRRNNRIEYLKIPEVIKEGLRKTAAPSRHKDFGLPYHGMEGVIMYALVEART